MPTDTKWTVTPVEESETFRIGNEAVITISPKHGFVSFSCIWHQELNGAHYWMHRGDASIWKFIRECEHDYVMGKLFHTDSLREFDLEASILEVKKYIIEARQNRYLKREEARDLWDEALLCESPEDICNLSIDDAHGFLQYCDKSCVTYFKKIWDLLCEHIADRP